MCLCLVELASVSFTRHDLSYIHGLKAQSEMWRKIFLRFKMSIYADEDCTYIAVI